MVNIGNYNPNDHEPNQAFDPLPSGWYAMQIVDSDVKPTKNGKGQYLWLELEILESQHPEHKGRKVWDRLNLWNENQQAVDISNGTLSSICRSIGHMGELSETEALHHKPLAVKLKVQAETQDYEASNEVKGYDAGASRFGGGAQATQPMAQPGTAQQAASKPQAQPAAKPPWA